MISCHLYHPEVHNTIGHKGGSLSVCGYTMTVPPGALPVGKSETFTLKILKESSKSTDVPEDEWVASFPFECGPSGVPFLKEIEMVIPHCALLKNPSRTAAHVYVQNLTRGNRYLVFFLYTFDF